MKNSAQEEIELKLQVAVPEEWVKICTFIRQMDNLLKEDTLDLAARYFDTTDRDLRREKIAYRVRKENEKWYATIKSFGSETGGLHRHREWNVEVNHGEPDLSAFSDGFIDRGVFKTLAEKRMYVLVETVFKRQIVLLKYENSLIEVAMDNGFILGGENKSLIMEVELELKEGCQADLLKLGAELSRRFCLIAEPSSKFVRGLALAGEVRRKELPLEEISGNDFVSAIHHFFMLIHQEWIERKAVRPECYEIWLKKIFAYVPLTEKEQEQMTYWCNQHALGERKNGQKLLLAALFLLWSKQF